ncbi:MAG: hypothetical protein Fur0025_07410 [Oscillatoriaceae cyanobacterium]
MWHQYGACYVRVVVLDGRQYSLEGRTMGTTSISERDIAELTPDDVKRLAVRLDQDEYDNPFDGLNDWHLLRAIAFHRPELVEPYIYLLDLEAYDEA